ncbi:MAG: MFS transporter [Armatimonadota bacterium]|nr:MFS transporter [Armatimonadota bacterium]
MLLTEPPTSESTTFRRPAIAAFAALFAYAAVLTMPQASVNQVQREFHLNDSTQGILFSMIMVGFLGGAVFGGRLSDRYGKLPITGLGCLMMSAAMFVFSQARGFGMLPFAAALAGIGGGLAEVVSMALVSDIYTGPARTRMMNWAQTAFCAGAVAQPLAFARFWSVGANWRTGYLAAAILCLACALMVACAAGGTGKRTTPRRELDLNWHTIIRNGFVLRLSIGLLLYVGAELGLANWVAAYMARDLGSLDSQASSSVALFWIGIGVGRIAATGLCGRCSDSSLIRWSLGLGAALMAALLLSRSSSVAQPVIFCVGVSLGPAWPTIVSRAGSAFPNQSGSVIGIVAAFGCVGGAIVPKLVGRVSDATNLRSALWICVSALVIGLIVVNIGGKKRPACPAEGVKGR